MDARIESLLSERAPATAVDGGGDHHAIAIGQAVFHLAVIDAKTAVINHSAHRTRLGSIRIECGHTGPIHPTRPSVGTRPGVGADGGRARSAQPTPVLGPRLGRGVGIDVGQRQIEGLPQDRIIGHNAKRARDRRQAAQIGRRPQVADDEHDDLVGQSYKHAPWIIRGAPIRRCAAAASRWSNVARFVFPLPFRSRPPRVSPLVSRATLVGKG